MDTVRDFFHYTKNPEEFGYTGFRPVYNYIPYARQVLSPALGALHFVKMTYEYAKGQKSLHDFIFTVTPLSIAKSALMLLVPVYTGSTFLALLFAVDVAIFALAPSKIVPNKKGSTPEGFFRELSKKLPVSHALSHASHSLPQQEEYECKPECKGVAFVSIPKQDFLDYIAAWGEISENYLSTEAHLSQFVTEENFGHIPADWVEAIPETYALFKACLIKISNEPEKPLPDSDFSQISEVLDKAIKQNALLSSLVLNKDNLKAIFSDPANPPVFVSLFVDFYSPGKEDFKLEKNSTSFIFKHNDFWQQVPADWLLNLLSTSPRAFFQLMQDLKVAIEGNFKGSLRKAYTQFLKNHRWIENSSFVSQERVGGCYPSEEESSFEISESKGDDAAEYFLATNESRRRNSVASSEQEGEDSMVVEKTAVHSFLKILKHRKKQPKLLLLPFEGNDGITSLRAIKLSDEKELP